MPPFTIAVAGTTNYSLACTQALVAAGITVPWILTPSPKPVGRQQILTPSPLSSWAKAHQLPVITVDKKINSQVKTQITSQAPPDMLLVVDFGYWVPDWLLAWSKQAVNIHPSALPRWRGSSPGQFTLLAGEKLGAVTIMAMSTKFDQGDIFWQENFEISPTWTATDYYDQAYELILPKLAQVLTNISSHQLAPQTQPAISPTATARKISKTDSFITWSVLKQILSQTYSDNLDFTPVITQALKDLELTKTNSPLLEELLTLLPAKYHPQLLRQAVLAFSPKPIVWTYLPTAKGDLRVKILSIETTVTDKLKLEKIMIDGKNLPSSWTQAQKLIV